MNPAVIIGNAAANHVFLFLIVVKRRGVHRWLRAGLRMWSLASHAVRVAGVSSVPPGVGNRTPHKQPPGDVEERQAASLGFFTHNGDDLVDAFRS